jgi:hypothetical protein
MKHLFTAAATVALMAGAADARELTFGMQDNEVSNVYKGAQAFAAELEKISGGELTVNLFPSSALGDFKAMVAQVQAGELDMVMTGYPDMSYVIPELKLVGHPMLSIVLTTCKALSATNGGRVLPPRWKSKTSIFWMSGTMGPARPPRTGRSIHWKTCKGCDCARRMFHF